MKYLLPIVFSIPTMVVWLLFLYARLIGGDVPFDMGLVGLSLISFCACTAMLIVRKNSWEWRVAAVFNGFPFVMVLLASLILPG